VDYPIDVVIYLNNSYRIIEHRFEKKDLQDISQMYREKISAVVEEIPEGWMNSILDKINGHSEV
jgi:putative proteasome-type protease